MWVFVALTLFAKPPQDPIDNLDPPTFPSPRIDRILVFHMDEAILAEAALAGVERLTDPTHDFRNFIKGALALAMLVAFVVGMYQGSVMRMMLAIGALGALWELGVKNRTRVRIDFYSPVMWSDYSNTYGIVRDYEVPFLLAKILSFSSGVNRYIAEAIDYSAQVLMGSNYLVKRYASSVAEAIKTATAVQYTDPKIRKAVAKFADHCVAPAISQLDPEELDQVGGQFRLVTALLRGGGPLSDGRLVVVDDVFSNQDPPPVVTCQSFLASIKDYMEGNEGTFLSGMSHTTRAKIELVRKYVALKLNTPVGTSITLTAFAGLGPILGAIMGLAAKGIVGAEVMNAPVQKPELSYASLGGTVSSDTYMGNAVSSLENMAGDIATMFMGLISRITYTVAQRGLPMLTGVMWYMIIMGFPIAVMAAGFMGWRTMLTYTFSVMWVGSWLPATVMVKQIMNAYMEIAGDQAVSLADATYLILQGFVSLDLLKSLYTSSDVAMIIATLLIISIPVVTGVLFFVALRGVPDRLITTFTTASGGVSQQVVYTGANMVTRAGTMVASRIVGGMVTGVAAAGSASSGISKGVVSASGGGAPFSTGGGSRSATSVEVPVRKQEPLYRGIPSLIVGDEPVLASSPPPPSGSSSGSEGEGGSHKPPDNTQSHA